MGSINYDLKKIRAILFDVDGVLSANTLPLDAEGQPMRTANIKDGYALHHAARQGVRMGIISGGTAAVVRRRYELLGLNPQDIVLGASNKMEHYRAFCRRHGLRDEEVAYVGDDIPDLEIMRTCGLPCCPADASPEAKEAAAYISPANGGHGVARDIVEQYLKANGLWMSDADAFGW